MIMNEYEHMNKLWKSFDIKSCDCNELYNVLDVIFLNYSFEHFCYITLRIIGVDLMHSIPDSQSHIHYFSRS